ncbi:MAG: 2-oxo acid dehydrogenase subunit E2, partial [Actinomycetota bacterium]|nr:2-oxo acid dehydrogenase subunit E2 [Actinomycetota bacterium]
MSVQSFRLPDVGEGLTEAEIVTWKVKPGDTVKVNDIVVEIETAKSLVELPTPYAGVVTALLVPEGQTVDVGTPIISVDTASGAAGAAAEPPGAAPGATEVAAAPEEGSVEPGLIGGPAPGGRTSVLVGYGPRVTEAKRRPRKDVAAQPVPAQPVPAADHNVSDPGVTLLAPPVESVESDVESVESDVESDVESVESPGAAGTKPLAKPPVRALAKQLGVDLASVPGTGPEGSVTRDDLQSFADAGPEVPLSLVGRQSARTGERETRTPIKGVRKMTAQAMVSSAFTAPHVSEFVTFDITRTMRLVERLKADREFAGVKVSPLLVVAKALLLAVQRNPAINASWDEPAQEIVVKHYVNLGIAAATPRGLVVPNIKDADALSLRELAEALAALTATAREGRTSPAEMAGGTITITNVGVFGVDTGTPILNPGEAAILAFGAVRQQPWVHRGKVRPRWVTTLALSFDHRLVDGELGSRFLADLARIL